ncbi:MAG: hypothetical protein IPJ69_11720 [Deltaproteobacteria bacterium]|nr:MAG: hypothetical protein IPJ69_11720 [Deltaproteobacteria bacterium]
MRNLSKKLYFILSGLSVLFLGQHLLRNINFTQQTAQADAVGTLSIAATCQAAPVQVWTTNMHYDVSWSEATAGEASVPEVKLSLETPVYGDTGQVLAQNILNQQGRAGHLLMTSRTPTYKMTGLLCRPYSQAHVNTYSGSLDNHLDIAFDDENSNPRDFDEHHLINFLNAQNSLTLIGVLGVTKNDSVADGADIGSDRPDGQIIVGGPDAGIIKTILNLREPSQNISQPVVLSMQAF